MNNALLSLSGMMEVTDRDKLQRIKDRLRQSEGQLRQQIGSSYRYTQEAVGLLASGSPSHREALKCKAVYAK